MRRKIKSIKPRKRCTNHLDSMIWVDFKCGPGSLLSVQPRVSLSLALVLSFSSISIWFSADRVFASFQKKPSKTMHGKYVKFYDHIICALDRTNLEKVHNFLTREPVFQCAVCGYMECSKAILKHPFIYVIVCKLHTSSGQFENPLFSLSHFFASLNYSHWVVHIKSIWNKLFSFNANAFISKEQKKNSRPNDQMH